MRYTEVVILVDKNGMQLRDQETLLHKCIKCLHVGCIPESSTCFDSHDSKLRYGKGNRRSQIMLSPKYIEGLKLIVE